MYNLSYMENAMNSYILFCVEFNRCYLPVIWYQNNFYIPLKLITQILGLNWERQSKKVRNISYGFRWCYVPDIRLDGSINDILCVMLSDLDAYLKSIDINSVPVRMRDILSTYQYGCARNLIRSLNSSNLDGVEAIIPSADYTLFNAVARQQHWNSEAMKRLGVCIGG